MTFKDAYKVRQKSSYRKFTAIQRDEALADTIDENKKVKGRSRAMRYYNWLK